MRLAWAPHISKLATARNQRGTVIVDRVDPRTRQLLWRGQGVTQVSDNPDPYANTLNKMVQSIAKKMLTSGA